MVLRTESSSIGEQIISTCLTRKEKTTPKTEEMLCLKEPKEIRWDTPVDYYYKVGDWPYYTTTQEDHGTLREIWKRQKGVEQLFNTLGISPKYFVDTQGDDGALLRSVAQLQSDVHHDRFEAAHYIADQLPSQFLKLVNRPGIGVSDPVDWVRARVVTLMEKFPESLPQVLQALEDKSPRVRGAAISALAVLDSEAAFQRITQDNGLLEDSSPLVSQRIYQVLGQPELSEGEKGEEVYQILMEREGKGIQDPDSSAREGAIRTLGELAPRLGKSGAVFKTLTQPHIGLDSENYGEFLATIAVLPKMASPEAVVFELTSRPNIGIHDTRWSPRRGHSLRELEDIGRNHPELQQKMIDALPLESWRRRANEMGYEDSLRAAYRLLARFRSVESLNLLLVYGLKDFSSWNREFVARELANVASTQDGILKELVVKALTEGLQGRRGEAPEVGLTDPDPEVVSASIETLQKLSSGTDWSESKRAWEEAHPVSENGCHVLPPQSSFIGFWGWAKRR